MERDGFSPIPAGAADAARRVPGVKLVATIRSTEAKLLGQGSKAKVTAPTPDIGQAVEVEWKKGGAAALRNLRDGQAVVSDSFASDHDLEVGDRLRLLSQTGAKPSFRVAGEFDSKLGVFGSVLITQAVMTRAFDQTEDTIDFVIAQPGADVAEVQAALTAGAERAFPTAEVLNQQELKETREEQVDQLVNLFYALLILAIVISLFGIANTLHVAHLLEGSVRKAGRTMRVTAQLIRAKDGVHLWSDTYDRDFKDVFKVQDEIAAAVVKALQVKLLSTPVKAQSEPHNTDAYSLYLQGQYFARRASNVDVERGIVLALRLVPEVAVVAHHRVVDEDVEPAEGVKRLGDDVAGTVPGSGRLARDGFAAVRLDLPDDAVGVGALADADVVDDDPRPVRGEQARVFAPDAAAGAGDDRNPALEAARLCGRHARSGRSVAGRVRTGAGGGRQCHQAAPTRSRAERPDRSRHTASGRRCPSRTHTASGHRLTDRCQ